jgi:hypothetical protein
MTTISAYICKLLSPVVSTRRNQRHFVAFCEYTHAQQLVKEEFTIELPYH